MAVSFSQIPFTVGWLVTDSAIANIITTQQEEFTWYVWEEAPALEEDGDPIVKWQWVEKQETADEVDEDTILEALIRQEEQEQEQDIAAGPVGSVELPGTEGISVEDLSAFTLDDVEVSEDDDESDDSELSDLDDLPVMIPDAGKIRFAEDIVDEFRGGARGSRRRKGGGNTRGGGGTRGSGGSRGGGAAAGGGR